MKKLQGSIIALNRKAFLLLSVVLSLVAFSVVAWHTNAQKESNRNAVDISTLPAAKQARVLLDRQNEAQAPPMAQAGSAETFAPTAPQGNPVVFAYDFFSDSLVSFNANTPGTVTVLPLTGLDTANAEFISGIDFRPLNGLLYGVASKGFPGTDRVVTINTTTGAVVSVSANTVPTLIDSFYGFDFNPVPDRIRQVGDADSSRRLNPIDGTVAGVDTPLAYAVGDANFGANPNVVHVAYTNNTTPAPAATTLYGIDSNLNILVRIGGVDGTPSPNGGQLTTVGPLGVDPSGFGGFDIQQGTNIAYASLFISGVPTFYRINLATGAATLVGTIGDGSAGIDGLSTSFSATGGSANLGITKTNGTTTVTPGTTTTYTIVASNAGPDPVVGATVTDTFPASLTSPTFTCTAAGGATCPAAAGTGNISALVNIPSGGTVTFVATATVAVGTTGSVSNTASIAAPAGVTDPTPANNSATDTDTVPTATPTPTPTATPTPTVTPTPTPTPTTFVSFSSATYSQDESQSAVITITRSGVTTGTSTVTFSTVAGGTATAGATCTGNADYQTTTATVTFGANVTSQTVSVPICGDTLVEAPETINFALSNPSSGTGIGTPGTAVLTINGTATQFCNTTPIVITGASQANPYPSNIVVAGATNNVFRIRVTLYDLSHVFPDNLDVLLVGPTGVKYVLMGDVGGPTAIPATAPVTLTFSDFATAVLPDAGPLVTGNFRPTTCETPVTSFPVGAPPAPYIEPGCTVARSNAQTLFGNFGGTNGNGTWSLYVRDDAGTAAPSVVNGEFTGGWCLELLPSTAAGVEVSGRVVTPDGRGLRNAQVTITDSTGNRRTATTSSFGYYSFEDVEVGSTFVVGVSSKRYRFNQRVLQVFDTLTDVDFVGQE